MKKTLLSIGLAGTLLLVGCGSSSNLSGNWSVMDASNPNDKGTLTINETANHTLTATITMGHGDPLNLTGTVSAKGDITLQAGNFVQATITGSVASSKEIDLTVSDTSNPNNDQRLIATRN